MSYTVGGGFVGCAVRVAVVKNLPTNIFLDIVKVLLCVDLMFSLPMVRSPPPPPSCFRPACTYVVLNLGGVLQILAATREVVEEPIVLGMKNWVETTRNIIRVGCVPVRVRCCTCSLLWPFAASQTTLVGLVFVICFGVPDFGDMVSLVGGFVNSLMGFILPPIIHMKQQVRMVARNTFLAAVLTHLTSAVRRGSLNPRQPDGQLDDCAVRLRCAGCQHVLHHPRNHRWVGQLGAKLCMVWRARTHPELHTNNMLLRAKKQHRACACDNLRPHDTDRRHIKPFTRKKLEEGRRPTQT